MNGTSSADRSPSPDREFADPRVHVRLRTAVRELSWLLGRGYAPHASQQLVGDRHQLDARMRAAVARCACSDSARQRRAEHEVEATALRGRSLAVDTYNVLTTVQVALGGGMVLLGRDGCARDLASVHGNARDTTGRADAIERTGKVLEGLGLSGVVWYVDRPVSRSAELGLVLEAGAREHGWPWSVQLVASPDGVLARTGDVVATSDSAVLDRCAAWFNLTRVVVESRAPEAVIVDLSG